MNPRTHSFIVLDFETGGLHADKNPITQVAFISITGDDFSEINRYYTYVRPYDDKLKYEQVALNITRTTMDDISSGKDIKEVSKEMVNLFLEANVNNTKNYKPILVGHNLKDFDIKFLHQISKYTKTDWSTCLQGDKDYFGNFQPQCFDTQYMARVKWGDDFTMDKHTLEVCCEKAGVDLVDAHNALNDVIATKELFLQFIINMRSEGDFGVEKMDTFRKHFQF